MPREDLPPCPPSPGCEDEDYAFRSRGSGPGPVASQVMGPAVGLMVAGGVGIALSVVVLAVALAVAVGVPLFPRAARPSVDDQIEAVANAGGSLLGVLLSALVLSGGLQMKDLRGYGWARAGSIAAMLPCHACFVLSLPLGLWALVILSKPEVKEAFR